MAKKIANNPKAKKAAPKSTASVQVKNAADVVRAFNAGVEYLFYTKVGKKIAKSTQTSLVAYGPWIMAALLLVVLPELLIFAKEARLVGFSGFFTAIFFNQASWVLMVIVFTNCILLADGLSDVFAKKRRGWDRLYLALLINGGYVLSQLAQNITRPAAPIISLAAIAFCLYGALDVRKYYK